MDTWIPPRRRCRSFRTCRYSVYHLTISRNDPNPMTTFQYSSRNEIKACSNRRRVRVSQLGWACPRRAFQGVPTVKARGPFLSLPPSLSFCLFFPLPLYTVNIFPLFPPPEKDANSLLPFFSPFFTSLRSHDPVKCDSLSVSFSDKKSSGTIKNWPGQKVVVSHDTQR